MYILWGVHTTTFSKLNKYSVIIHFYRTMITMKYINAETPYNFQWEKLKVENEDRGSYSKYKEYTPMPYGE